MRKTQPARRADSAPSTTASQPESTGTTESSTTEGGEGGDPDKPEAPADPFAALPTVELNGYKIPDFSGVQALGDPRKYQAAHEAAISARSQVKTTWKHREHMLMAGSVDPSAVNVKPTSVMGIVSEIVRTHGKGGVPAYVVASILRQRAAQNKRSVYCNGKLPAIGWAEGYIDGAIAKKYIKVKEGVSAPSLTQPASEQPEQGERQAA